MELSKVQEVFVPLIGSNCLLRISGFVLNVQFLFYFIFFFKKDLCSVLWKTKSKQKGHDSSPGSGEEQGMQHTGFQPIRAGYGSCKRFAVGWKGNFSASVCWCFANCCCFRGTFSTCAYLEKAKYFYLRFLDSPLNLSCCTEILGLLQVFVEFLCTDSEEDFIYVVANYSLTAW